MTEGKGPSHPGSSLRDEDQQEHSHSNARSPLLPMDIRVLAHLIEVDGRAPSIAIPLKLFNGIVPEGHPDLADLGFIAHEGDDVVITDAGRAALLANALKNFTEGRDISYVAALEHARNVLKVA